MASEAKLGIASERNPIGLACAAEWLGLFPANLIAHRCTPSFEPRTLGRLRIIFDSIRGPC